MIEDYKELIAEVLGFDDIAHIQREGESSLIISRKYNRGVSINIYELAHNCKEWVLSKGYYLRAEQGINYHDNLQWTCFLNTNMDDGAEYIDYWNLTEVEAIMKACQWVLGNRKQND